MKPTITRVVLLLLFFCFSTGIAPLFAAEQTGTSSLSGILQTFATLVTNLIKAINETLAQLDNYVKSLEKPAEPPTVSISTTTEEQSEAAKEEAITEEVADKPETESAETPVEPEPVVAEESDDFHEEASVSDVSEKDQDLYEQFKDLVNTRIEQAIDEFLKNLPESEAEISSFRHQKANKIIKDLKNDLKKMSIQFTDEETGKKKKISGINAFKDVYSCTFAEFHARLGRAYTSTYGFFMRWTLMDNMVEISPDGKTPSTSSLMDIEDEFEKYSGGNSALNDLQYKFMQKAIDTKELCGHPDFYIEQAATVLHTAWNAHGKVWNSIKNRNDYNKYRKLIRKFYSFWIARDVNKPYFDTFLKKAGIDGVTGFRNVLNSIKRLLDSFEDSMVEVNAETKGESEPSSDDGKEESTSKEESNEEELPVKIIVDKDGIYASADKFTEEIEYPYIELTFNADEIKKEWPLMKKPLSEKWLTTPHNIQVSFVKTDKEILVVLPKKGDKLEIKENEQIGELLYVRKPVGLRFTLTLDQKMIYVTPREQQVEVRVSIDRPAKGVMRRTPVYNKKHKVPVDYEIIEKMKVLRPKN
ncbi:MAG: hypothetical protein ACOYXC_14705 [Candidatus Rifleibacteriota bacterium]